VYFRKFVNLNPKVTLGHYQLGNVLLILKKSKEAMFHFERALELANSKGQKNLINRIREQLQILQH
jgi:hypothetical protein